MRDERARLDGLVRESLPAALRFAMRLTGNVQDAEEIVQRALLNVVTHWDGFRAEADFRTWFFRIVINTFRDATAGKQDGSLSETEPIDPQQRQPADLLMGRELRAHVAACVSGLPPRQREVFVLTFYEHLSPDEVARSLDIGVDNVYACLHLARKRLRQQLQHYLDGASDETR